MVLIFLSIRSLRGLIEDEVFVMFDQFFHNVVLHKSLTSFFVALVPKVKCLLKLGDFRLISLLGSLYKLVAKVLVSRLTRVIEKLIYPN